MLYLAAISAALATALVVYMTSLAAPARSQEPLRHRMVELGLEGAGEEARRGERRERRRKLEQLIVLVGEKFKEAGVDYGPLRERLVHAGYRRPSALVLFLGVRVVGTVGLSLIAFALAVANEFTGPTLVATVVWGIVTGWFVPGLMVSSRASARKKEVQLALPDALDLLVICVEAGLGLNLALIRVAREIRHVSTLLAEELSATNFQIRAGVPREEALKSLSERTGVRDVRTLVTTIIQTERFGTSIAQSLRVHADDLRLRRKQRAEEAAAKTTIKIVFPLAI